MTASKGLAPRRAALDVLTQVRSGRPFDAALDRALRRLAEPTAGWRTSSPRACCGARRRSTRGSLPLVPRGWPSVPSELQDVLRLGAFQLTALDRVPAHAAVDTSVALAKEAGGAAGRRVRERGAAAPRRLEPEAMAAAADGACRVSRRRKRSPGVTRTRTGWWSAGSRGSVRRRPSRAAGVEQHAGPRLVLQPARRSAGRRWSALATAGIEVEPGAVRRRAGDGPARPQELPGYAEGAFLVQDPAQALLAWYADLPAGATVYDAVRGARRQDDRARARSSAGRRGRRQPHAGAAPRREPPPRRQRPRAPDRGGRAPAAGPAGRCGAARCALSRHRHLRAASGCALAGHARGAGSARRHPGRAARRRWPTWSRRAGS